MTPSLKDAVTLIMSSVYQGRALYTSWLYLLILYMDILIENSSSFDLLNKIFSYLDKLKNVTPGLSNGNVARAAQSAL